MWPSTDRVGPTSTIMVRVGELDVQERIRRDLAAGDTHLACQRLRGLINTYPQRLDLRDQLGQLSRQQANSGEAGRWLYIGGTATPSEQAAFEARFPEAVYRMKAVKWRGDESAAGAAGAERLARLRLAAEAEAGRPLTWDEPLPPRPETSVKGFLAGWVLGTLLMLTVGGILALALKGILLLWHLLSP